MAAIFPFVWPTIFMGIMKAGEMFAATGAIGTFFYGFTMRLLNVFGLHHAIISLCSGILSLEVIRKWEDRW